MLDNFARLNSATKYPSIETYHELGERGILAENVTKFPEGRVWVTEKIDGTNIRIVVDSDGDYAIGERDSFLHAKGDRIPNEVHGAVAAVKPFLEVAHLTAPQGKFRTFFVEVYGGKIGKSHKQYTENETLGFRLFDVLDVPEDILDIPQEEIASWRNSGNQEFLSALEVKDLAESLGILTVPPITILPNHALPTTVEETMDWLTLHLPETRAALSSGALCGPEGVVLRTNDRSVIRKARFASYVRTIEKRKVASQK